ncbi:MAG: hypothetical protein AMJ81_03155 [Phycisphaerae bacterium SM23_33]|nr:MAG: hypothetical protein AMJ81_03155 [Phycisphaerae bacterium SM23_33]
MAHLVEDLVRLIQTRHAIVTLQTVEEDFAARTVREAALAMHMPVMEWSVSDGLHRVAPDTCGLMAGTETLTGALRFMRGNDTQMVYVLKDAIRHLNAPAAERLLRDVAADFAQDRRTVFMFAPGGELPAALRPLAVPYELALPDADEIYKLVRKTVRDLSLAGEVVVDLDRVQLQRFLANLCGLTRMEIIQVVAEAVLSDGRLNADDIGRAIELKRQRLRQTGVLDYVPVLEAFPSVGGMKALRRWLSLRAKAMTPEARRYGLESPRGVLLLGVQGCGKSLMARFVAFKWKLPLLRMDVGALYDKYVGESERHLRTAFGTASAMAPCVLWIDEIEKAFASAGTGPAGAVSDGGLSQRMFGQLLTWMQDHKDPVFLVATANDVTALPPELMRKGRFDEVFFVDLPSADARREIFRIHLAKRKRDPAAFDLDALAEASGGFSGSEIEQAVVAAMYAAFAKDRELTQEDISAELAATRPLSVLMAERIDNLRAWAEGRCVKAN